MSRLSELIARVRAADKALGDDLDTEVKTLAARRPFGLNFERHRPESVELPGRPVRKGDKVRILPPRGTTARGDRRLWTVKGFEAAGEAKTALLTTGAGPTLEQRSVPLEDLVVVAEEKDFLYPGLVSTGKVERGGDKPFHTVINGENLHALTALTCTHRGKIDVIYIDPPYNSGSRDWKYNNDYVERDDLYRHSKWLAMMERRLLLARELLNPAASSLIVTIDEKEYLRLGMLLEQVFPDASVQMITTVISPKGNARRGLFSRADEYIFFVLLGDAYVTSWSSDMLRDAQDEEQPVRWKSLLRSAGNGLRTARPNLFYPLFFDSNNGGFVGAGVPLKPEDTREAYSAPNDTIIVWPLGNDGRELTWSLGRETLIRNQKKGYVRFGPWDGRSRTPYYLTTGQILDLEHGSGELTIIGTDADGALELSFGNSGKQYQPLTVWNRVSHSATDHGTGLLKQILPTRSFPFPKSVYAVEDVLRFLVGKNKESIILDFFSGSGTTAHAVMRLNKQDGGQRQCISITNNEVAADEQAALRKAGLRPGDAEWEKWGICDHITKPRIRAAITGRTPEGEPIKGDYKFTDEFPMADGFAENAEFFTLTYETPVAISHNRAFERIAPLLWMRAGAMGRRIDKLPKEGFALAETYGLLTDVDAARAFGRAVRAAKGLRMVFIVTDDERRFQAIAQRLPPKVEPVRLYESYLTNFRFAMGR